MKVNRRYSTTLPSLEEYKALILKLHELQSMVQELVPRSLEISIEIMNDAIFLNEENGRPIGALQVGQGLPHELIECFADEIRTLVSVHRKRNGFI